MIETLHLTTQLYSKIFSGMFLTGPSIFVICLFCVTALAFLVKAKLES